MLIAGSLIKGFNNKRYVNWAIELISNGYESESIYILAGLDDDDSISVEKYFALAANDFAVNIEIENSVLIDRYAVYIIENAIVDRDRVDNTVEMLRDFVDKTSFCNKKHFDFLYLYEELEELTRTPRKEFAITEFRAFLKEIKR